VRRFRCGWIREYPSGRGLARRSRGIAGLAGAHLKTLIEYSIGCIEIDTGFRLGEHGFRCWLNSSGRKIDQE